MLKRVSGRPFGLRRETMRGDGPRDRNKIWYSRQWDNAPMPHAVFFTRDGHAIHGTDNVEIGYSYRRPSKATTVDAIAASMAPIAIIKATVARSFAFEAISAAAQAASLAACATWQFAVLSTVSALSTPEPGQARPYPKRGAAPRSPSGLADQVLRRTRRGSYPDFYQQVVRMV